MTWFDLYNESRTAILWVMPVFQVLVSAPKHFDFHQGFPTKKINSTMGWTRLCNVLTKTPFAHEGQHRSALVSQTKTHDLCQETHVDGSLEIPSYKKKGPHSPIRKWKHTIFPTWDFETLHHRKLIIQLQIEHSPQKAKLFKFMKWKERTLNYIETAFEYLYKFYTYTIHYTASCKDIHIQY